MLSYSSTFAANPSLFGSTTTNTATNPNSEDIFVVGSPDDTVQVLRFSPVVNEKPLLTAGSWDGPPHLAFCVAKFLLVTVHFYLVWFLESKQRIINGTLDNHGILTNELHSELHLYLYCDPRMVARLCLFRWRSPSSARCCQIRSNTVVPVGGDVENNEAGTLSTSASTSLQNETVAEQRYGINPHSIYNIVCIHIY
ncbi:unnamed protein product [Cylicocyclus nassatus]|uniref:Uncharacterized protein n=1 Tax=Cylicocyclus nassatus TaxID=53992 RepID=A0AA36GWJ1_CYLNA|nr:unnamed protein product [Cylicocyclus nassatus]